MMCVTIFYLLGRIILLSFFVGLVCNLQACAFPGADDRIAQARQLAYEANWQELDLPSRPFALRSYINQQPTINGELTIYIEGDGVAWVDGQYPSRNPTPIEPIALKLALKQPIGASAYLARPCQFIGLENRELCNSSAWTSARFSGDAIDSTNQAINLLKMQTRAQKLVLVGYSGGAAIALLTAAGRQDVSLIISVAGNVDPFSWVATHQLDILVSSLDTKDSISKLSGIRQIYFVGGNDRVIPRDIAKAFADKFEKNTRPIVMEIVGNGHSCCWVRQWPELWKLATEN